MKLLFLFISFLIMSCNGQKLKAKVFNKTGHDLDSVYLGEIYIGRIAKEMSVEVLNCQKIEMQDRAPFMLAAGCIKEKKKDSRKRGYCGTGLETITEGNYKFDITLRESAHGYRLEWRPHCK